uniref:Homeobox-leucine zipper protein HAT2 isoform X5 n=1 Tax=Elaeis guineensis var. tenera TaxID=51953 RepID=A0A6J0PNY8_ELAGV|nr:homeobox-leucine zipper protein HAT2 isoform X5 [Elaeis guineensis]
MDIDSSMRNGDWGGNQSLTSQEPKLMDKDGGQPTIHPSLQLELKLPWSTETESAGDEAKSRGGVKGPTGSDDPCDDTKPSPSASHRVIAERGSQGRHNDSEGDGGRGRKKLRLSKEQSCYLEECFKEHTTLNPNKTQAERGGLQILDTMVRVSNRREPNAPQGNTGAQSIQIPTPECSSLQTANDANYVPLMSACYFSSKN